MKRICKLTVLFTILSLLFLPPLFAQKSSLTDLTILHVNDTHGHILPYVDKSVNKKIPVGGSAYLAKMINDERSKNPDGTLLLSAGDMFQGTPVSNVFKGKSVIDIMNYLKFDAMTLGNHEFDWGLDTLDNLRTSATFPFLSANVVDISGHPLRGIKPYVILSRKNRKIALIGVTVPAPSIITPDLVKRVTFLRPEDVLPGLIKKVKDEGADIVIVLSHLGIDADRELAQRIGGINIIVGGHSHTAIKTPVVVGNTIITQAGCYGLYLGVLKLKVEKGGGEIAFPHETYTLKNVRAGPEHLYDENVARIVQVYYDRIKDEFGKIVGETAVNLVRNSSRESNIGNLICDVMRMETDTDVAFINSGAIRTNIRKGKITLEQVFTLLPFDNSMVTLELTGRQILDILEHSAKGEHGILQVSGMKVQYDLSEPVGSRIKKVLIGNTLLNTRGTYRVTTVDFLVKGGDGYSTFKEGKNVTYGMSLRDLFVSYLRKHSPVSPHVGNRILINTSYYLLPLSHFHRALVFPGIEWFPTPARHRIVETAFHPPRLNSCRN